MAKHGAQRSRPAELVPCTVRIISALKDYLPPDAADRWEVAACPEQAFIPRYALGMCNGVGAACRQVL